MTPHQRPFRMVGLTGGIASGKSTVSSMLSERGLAVIDADVVARQVVEPGSPALSAIVERFGPDVLTGGGHLDRGRLGTIVFGDDEARSALNAIVHPAVAGRTAQLAASYRESGRDVVVYDVPLLVENGLHHAMNLVVVVSASPQTQLCRMMARDGLGEAEARQRIDAQLPLEDKLAVADVVIDNDGTLASTVAQVDELVANLDNLLWPDHEGAQSEHA